MVNLGLDYFKVQVKVQCSMADILVLVCKQQAIYHRKLLMQLNYCDASSESLVSVENTIIFSFPKIKAASMESIAKSRSVQSLLLN